LSTGGTSKLTTIESIDISGATSAGAQDALKTIDAALAQIDAQRADLGAVQNRFTEIFTRSDTEREKLFDKMFNVGIYRQIFDELNSKESIEKEYTLKISECNGQLELLTDTAIDTTAIKEQLKAHQESLDGLTTSLETVEKEIATTAAQKDHMPPSAS